jgi:hypothetical protein
MEASHLEESSLRKSKASSNVGIISNKLKGPDILAKVFQSVIEKRKLEEDERKAQELKRQALEEKRRVSVKKEV